MQTLFLSSYGWSDPGQTLPALVESVLAELKIEGKARLGGHLKWGRPIRDAKFGDDWEGLRAGLASGIVEDLRVHAPAGQSPMAFHLYLQASRGRITPGHRLFLDPELPETQEDLGSPRILALSLDGAVAAGAWLAGKLAEWAMTTGAAYGFFCDETAMPITTSFQLADPTGRSRIRFEDVDYRRRIPAWHAFDFLGPALVGAVLPGELPAAERGLDLLKRADGALAGACLERSASGPGAARLRAALDARLHEMASGETWLFLGADQVARAGGPKEVARMLAPPGLMETGEGGLLLKDRPVITPADSVAYTSGMQALFEAVVPEARSKGQHVTEAWEDMPGWESPGQIIRRIPRRSAASPAHCLQVTIDREMSAPVTVLGEGPEAAEKEMAALVAERLPGRPGGSIRTGKRFRIDAFPDSAAFGKEIFPLIARLDALNTTRCIARYLVLGPPA